jgi:hypothetical protein
MGGLGHTSISPAIAADGAGQARKRNAGVVGFDSSPGSMDDVEEVENREEKRRQPVKRACNECRQQKVRFPLLVPPPIKG